MKPLLIVSFLALMTLVLGGCEALEDRLIAEAKQCLGQATTAADGTTCLSKVSGLTSAAASEVRCIATYVQRNFVGTTKYQQAFEALDNEGAAGSPMLGMMSILAFGGANTNHSITGRRSFEDASYLSTECNASGAKGMIMLASFTKAATEIARVKEQLLGGVSDPENIQPAELLDAIQNNPGDIDDTTLGETAIAAHESFCTEEDANDPDNEICSELGAAISSSGGDTATIGAKLACLLEDAGPCP